MSEVAPSEVAPGEDARVGLGRVLADVALAAGPTVALAVLATVPSCCVVFLPVFLVLAGKAYERAMGLRASRVGRWRLGLAGAPLFLAPIAAFFVAASLVRTPGEASAAAWAPVLVAEGVSILLTTVLFPLYGAPFEAIERGSGVLDGWIGSGARAAERGVLSTFAHGALVGAIGAAPWALVPALSPWLRGSAHAWLIFASLALGAMVAVTVNLAIVARFWSDARERFGTARVPSAGRIGPIGSSRRRLASSLVVSLAPLALLGAALVVSLASPSPAWRRTPPEAPLVAVAGPPGGLRVDPELTVPGGAGLTFSSPELHAWSVRTADGGGAGEVRVRDAVGRHGWVVRERFRGVEGWTLVVPTRDGAAAVTVDEDGVRLDDTPLDRLEARVGGTTGLAVAGAILALLALLALVQLHAVGVAAGLDRPRFRGHRELAAIEGTFRAPAPALANGRELRVPEGARLVLGELGAVSLPQGPQRLLVGDGARTVTDGATLTLVATLAPSQGSPFRDGAAPLPPDARFVVGSLESAREVFAQTVARRNALASIPLAALALALTAVVFVNL